MLRAHLSEEVVVRLSLARQLVVGLSIVQLKATLPIE